MVKAMYAFSGDPITYGHIDIVKRAAKDFDEVVVGIGVNPDKKYMFDLIDRVKMATKSLDKLPNVKVVSFEGLLVHYAYEKKIDVIVKGVRNSVDFDYEAVLHQVGESQKLGVNIHILFARPELAHISSSTVKALQKEQGLIHKYVPLHVKQLLEAKMSGQYIVSITGEIGSGKSYVSDKFVELGEAKGIEVHNIDLDKIGHAILGGFDEPIYLEIRKEVADCFGDDLLCSDGTIDRSKLGEIVFGDVEKLKRLNDIMRTPILVRLRKELKGKKGLILINAALIAETEVSYLSNNNVVLVKVDKAGQKRRLECNRGLTDEQIKRRVGSQYDFEMKKEKLDEIIARDAQGKIWLLENSEGSDESEIERVFNKIVGELKVE